MDRVQTSNLDPSVSSKRLERCINMFPFPSKSFCFCKPHKLMFETGKQWTDSTLKKCKHHNVDKKRQKEKEKRKRC